VGWYTSISFRAKIIFVCLLSTCLQDLYGQLTYSARFRLASLDTTTRVACYHIQLANPGTEEWQLFSYNINIFYDARVGEFLKDSVISDTHVSESAPRNSVIPIGTVTNSGLTYDSIGFLRVGVSEILLGQSQVIPAGSDWTSISQVCFTISLDDITDPNTCFTMNFSDPQSQAATGARPDIVQAVDLSPTTVSVDLVIVDLVDVIPNRTFNSCFVLDEDNEDLCSDGIDNDEDGLLDCDDPSCHPGSPSTETLEIECFRPEGELRITGGTASGLTYSIDGGVTFSSDSIFPNLSADLYDVVVRRNNVASCEFTSPVILQAPNCDEADDISCTDGRDNDGDGLIDCDDPNCQPILDTIIVSLPVVCPALIDGTILISSELTDIEYSIDSGLTYQEAGLFESLGEGTYHVMTRNPITLCELPYEQNPVIVDAQVRCQIIPELPPFYMPNIINPNNSPFDLLSITSEEEFQLLSFEVFDRWGNQVYEASNFSSMDGTGWDGRYPNGEVVSGVYIYVLEVDFDGDVLATTGDVMVIN